MSDNLNNNNLNNQSENPASDSSDVSHSDAGYDTDTASDRSLLARGDDELFERDPSRLRDEHLRGAYIEANNIAKDDSMHDEGDDESRDFWKNRRNALAAEWLNREDHMGPLPVTRMDLVDTVSESESNSQEDNSDSQEDNSVSQIELNSQNTANDPPLSQDDTSHIPNQSGLSKRGFEEIDVESSPENSNSLGKTDETGQPSKKIKQDSSDVNADCELVSYGWDDGE